MGCEKCTNSRLPQCDLKLVSSCFEEDLKGRELQHISALEHICYDCLNFLQNQVCKIKLTFFLFLNNLSFFKE